MLVRGTTFPPQTIWLQRTSVDIQNQRMIRKAQREIQPAKVPPPKDEEDDVQS